MNLLNKEDMRTRGIGQISEELIRGYSCPLVLLVKK
jgi:hypothetical protein